MNARTPAGGLGLMVAIALGVSATACGTTHSGDARSSGCTSRKATTASGAVTATTGAHGRTRLQDDFNGDGYADVALLGVFGGPAVVYGSPDGLRPSSEQFFSGTRLGVPTEHPHGDDYPAALNSIDLDRDGYADLVVGEKDPDTEVPGALYVIWGGRHGLSGATPLSSRTTADGFGSLDVVGDFDGDGAPDVATTDKRDDTLKSFRDLQVLYGPFDRHGTPAGGVRDIRSPEPLTAEGYQNSSLVAGDMNGDGITDVVSVDAWDKNMAGDRVGQVALWKGTRKGLVPGAADLAGSDRPLKNVAHSALGIGDVNGDHRADLVIGRPGSDTVTYLPGGPNGPDAGRARTFTPDSPGVPGSAEPHPDDDYDGFGSSIAVGDIDGDGHADAAVGMTGTGTVITMPGTAQGLTGKGARRIGKDTPGVPCVPPGTNHGGTVRFGSATKLADTDGDGRADLIVGDPDGGHDLGERGCTGLVWALRSTGHGVDPNGSTLIDQERLGTPTEDLGAPGGFD